MVDEYAATVVRRIFSMYVSGCGKNNIAKNLNLEGILCPTEYKKINGEKYKNGRRLETTFYWTFSTINQILHNEMYAGNMVQGKKSQDMGGPTIDRRLVVTRSVIGDIRCFLAGEPLSCEIDRSYAGKMSAF